MQPVDCDAAAKFDEFFYELTETVAAAEARPGSKAGNGFAPKVGKVSRADSTLTYFNPDSSL